MVPVKVEALREFFYALKAASVSLLLLRDGYLWNMCGPKSNSFKENVMTPPSSL